MPVHSQASIEDLYRVPGKAEIVNGELRLMSPLEICLAAPRSKSRFH